MTITAKRLKELGACQDQIDAFRAIWGDGPAPMTVEAAIDHAEAFDWRWAARMLLTDAAYAEYDRATAPAWAEYGRATAAARAEYDRATAPAWAEYKRAMSAAWAEYWRARARAFATLYIKQEAA
jgi:hypothetical protein